MINLSIACVDALPRHTTPTPLIYPHRHVANNLGHHTAATSYTTHAQGIRNFDKWARRIGTASVAPKIWLWNIPNQWQRYGHAMGRELYLLINLSYTAKQILILFLSISLSLLAKARARDRSGALYLLINLSHTAKPTTSRLQCRSMKCYLEVLCSSG